MNEFKDLDPYLVEFLFSKGLDRPYIKLFGETYKIPLEAMNKAVSIAKEDKDLTAMRNACKAYRTAVKDI